MKQSPTKLELLAPARDCAIARQAVDCGADAVYIGAEAFGARVAAANSVDDIASLVDYAHDFDARIYVTLNTLIYDDELREAERLIRRLYTAGVDALIVQDLGILRMDIPPIALHASTQCDTRTPEKARFLQDCGFSQIVLARELSLDEIRDIASVVSVPLEAFVHGALCVSYSGDCQASLFATGRSANRGECAQMCRLPYTLTGADGRQLAPEAHYLSLRDMNRLDRLADLADAGVSSFKIEGRLKDSSYVRNAVAAYSQALDGVIRDSAGRFSRASAGTAVQSFTPDLNSSFNRRFTTYFLDGRPSPAERMSSADSPKWIGSPVGTVVSCKGRELRVRSTAAFNNGDGLGYFDPSGRYCGFRINRVDRGVIHLAAPLTLAPGTKLYRNRDKRRDDEMAAASSRRTISVDMTLRRIDDSRIALRVVDERGLSVELTADAPAQPSRTPQRDRRLHTLDRLGDTVFTLRSLDDTLPDDTFVTASCLADLRRRAVEALLTARRATYPFDRRRPEAAVLTPFKDTPLDRHDNVANRLAADFYKSHAIDVSARAAEVNMPDASADRRVMTTRYCLRRELGACLRTPGRDRLPRQLFLRAPGVSYRLDFDCAACRMHVIIPAKPL